MKIAQVVLYCAAFVSMLIGPSAVAQVADMAPAAPVPAQIANGKTAFISNDGIGISSLSNYIESNTGSANGLYNEFYAGMKSWGKYQLVDTPANADLVFEIQLLLEHPAVGVNPDVQVRILDPKTRVVLWEFREYMTAGSGRAATRRKHWEAVMAKVMNDIKQLVGQSAGAGG